MCEIERNSSRGVGARNMSSSDFFSIPTANSTVAHVAVTSPVASLSVGGRSSAAVMLPDAWIDNQPKSNTRTSIHSPPRVSRSRVAELSPMKLMEARGDVGESSAGEFTPTLAPSPQWPLRELECLPTAQAMSPSPVMSLARPTPMSPSTAASHGCCHDAVGGGGAAGTSSAGDNCFSMVMGMDSQLHLTKPPFQSHSHLPFMPLDDEPALVPDEMWECSISDVNQLGRPDTYARSSRSPSLRVSPAKSEKRHRGRVESAATAAAAGNGGGGGRGDSDGSVADVGSSFLLVDDLLDNDYFDGMLPMMLQYGDAMLRMRQRGQWRREEEQSRAGATRGRRISVSLAASRPAPLTGDPGLSTAEAGMVARGQDDDLMDDSYGLNEYGPLDEYDLQQQHRQQQQVHIRTKDGLIVSALLAQAVKAEGKAASRLRADADADALAVSSCRGSPDDGDHAGKPDNASTSSAERAASSVMCDVEDLMATLNIMSAPLKGVALTSKSKQNTPAVAANDQEERKGSGGHAGLYAAVTAVQPSVSTQAISCSDEKKMSGNTGDGHSDSTTDCVVLPRLSSEVRALVRRCATATAASPPPPPHTVLPLPTWSLPGPASGSRQPRQRAVPSQETASPPAAPEAIVPVGKDSVSSELRPPPRPPTPSPQQQGSDAAADVPGAAFTPAGTPSRQGQSQPPSTRQPQTRSLPPTIAEMLQARATTSSDRVAPLALLVKDDESVRDAPLSLQPCPCGQQQQPQLFSRTAIGGEKNAERALTCATHDTASLSAADAWQAVETITFSEAARRTTSRTVPEMARLVTNGFNVSLISLHARCAKPADLTSWGSLLPEFFTAFFRCVAEQNTPTSCYSAKLTVALLKCDLYRDLLSDVVRLTPVTLLGAPLLGVRLKGLTAVPVYSVAECLRTLSEAHDSLSGDDYANGSFVVTLAFKQHKLDVATGELRDVLLSSFTTFASNVDVYSDILQAERLPATAGLLLQLFRGPVQAAVAVYTRRLERRSVNLRRALEVQRALRSRTTLPPRVGSTVGLLTHIRNELQAFRSVLEASQERQAAEQQQQARTESSTCEVDAYRRERAQRAQLRYVLRALTCLSNDCKVVLSDPVTKLPPFYLLCPRAANRSARRLRHHSPRQGHASPHHHSSSRGESSQPNTHERATQPYTSTLFSRLRSDADAEKPKRAGGDECDTVNNDGVWAAEAELQVKDSATRRDGTNCFWPSSAAAAAAAAAGPRSRTRRLATLAEGLAALDWRCNVPQTNLFAGDSACGWRGIRPMFRSTDPQLRAAFFVPNTAAVSGASESPVQSAPMQTVVYVEEHGPDRMRSPPLEKGDGEDTLKRSSALRSGKARGGVVGFTVNDHPVGASRAAHGGMPHFQVGELCVRNLDSSKSGHPATAPELAARVEEGADGGVGSSGAASVTIKSAFRCFLEGQNIAIFSVTESGAETDAVTRMLRSPLWLALREMVETALQSVDDGDHATPNSRRRQVLYMSITQPLSIDCVKDHLQNSDVAGNGNGKGEAHHGVSTNSFLSPPAADEVMPFQSAWTPAGPVVAGACYIPITSVAQFYKITRDLPAHVQAVAGARRTESLGGTHVLVSFLMHCLGVSSSTATAAGATSDQVESPCSTPSAREPARVATDTTTTITMTAAAAARSPEQVFFTAATVLLSTESTFWNTLQLGDYVSPSHPLNLLRPIYCHRVVNVVDVAASAIDRAWPLLLMQERVTQHRRFQLWRTPWSVNAYTTYLARRREALRWCMTNLISQAPKESTVVAAAEVAANVAGRTQHAKGRLQIDLQRVGTPEWVRDLFYGKRVWLSDLTAVLRQVELMYAVGVGLLESQKLSHDSWTADSRVMCQRPMALFEGRVMYDVTAPPKEYVRTPLDPLPLSNDEKDLAVGTITAATTKSVFALLFPAAKPLSSPLSALRLASAPQRIKGTSCTEQRQAPMSLAGVQTPPSPRRNPAKAADATEDEDAPLPRVAASAIEVHPRKVRRTTDARFPQLKLAVAEDDEAGLPVRPSIAVTASGISELRNASASAAPPFRCSEPSPRGSAGDPVVVGSLFTHPAVARCFPQDSAAALMPPPSSPRPSSRQRSVPLTTPVSPLARGAGSFTHSLKYTQRPSSALDGRPAMLLSLQRRALDPLQTLPLTPAERRSPTWARGGEVKEAGQVHVSLATPKLPFRRATVTPAASPSPLLSGSSPSLLEVAPLPSATLRCYTVFPHRPVGVCKSADATQSPPSGNPVGASVTVTYVGSASHPCSAASATDKLSANATSHLLPHPPRSAESLS